MEFSKTFSKNVKGKLILKFLPYIPNLILFNFEKTMPQFHFITAKRAKHMHNLSMYMHKEQQETLHQKSGSHPEKRYWSAPFLLHGVGGAGSAGGPVEKTGVQGH